jgi:hypothetical protein
VGEGDAGGPDCGRVGGNSPDNAAVALQGGTCREQCSTGAPTPTARGYLHNLLLSFVKRSYLLKPVQYP